MKAKTATKISSIRRADENYNIIVHYTTLYYYTVVLYILLYYIITCLSLLKERCEDKQLTIHSHMSKLLKLENITDAKDVG